MRMIARFMPVLALALVLAGCGSKKQDIGPTVDAFVGRLVQNSKPVTLPAEQKPALQLFHEKGQSFGIPIKPDGTFTIGWMPIGKYSAVLKRDRPAAKGGPNNYSVPGGLTIQDGRTDYTIELGKNWKL